ncbi:hypothetical protein [Achromobacter dolens]|uniref:hypothetical protein n=1 Tax=Achromobacter dolens TaxID=1287738 RepID=UPI00158406FD|nr:hypothetical protein [Achromobacter dolens]
MLRRIRHVQASEFSPTAAASKLRSSGPRQQSRRIGKTLIFTPPMKASLPWWCGVSPAPDDPDYQGGNIRNSPISKTAANSHIRNFLFFMANSKSRWADHRPGTGPTRLGGFGHRACGVQQ